MKFGSLLNTVASVSLCALLYASGFQAAAFIIVCFLALAWSALADLNRSIREKEKRLVKRAASTEQPS